MDSSKPDAFSQKRPSQVGKLKYQGRESSYRSVDEKKNSFSPKSKTCHVIIRCEINPTNSSILKEKECVINRNNLLELRKIMCQNRMCHKGNAI
jgi:hypothetical protein